MPYDPNNPPEKLKNLSDKKQRQWVEVFNSCYSKTPDEKKCHMMAWGVVKKSAADESLKDIVDQNPELVAKIEKMFGMRWNGDKFDALYYPDIAKSEVDRVDNAPSGITAKEKREAGLVPNPPLRELKQVADILASSNFSSHDCAYASYCLDGLDVKWTSMVGPLYDNVLAKYRKDLLGWFSEALIDRSNLIQVRGLGKVLTEFVQDVPNAILTDGTPDISKFKADWQFLNSDRLAMAGRKVVAVVKEDSVAAGLWTEDEFSVEEPPIYFDNRYRVWNIPYSDWTLQNRNLLIQLGMRVDRQRRWWYTTELTPKMKEMFDVNGENQNVKVMIPPGRAVLTEWYLKKWLPQNVGRFKNLFEGYIREAGSSLQFNFSVNGKGKVDVTLKRGISKLSDAIEELRVRYLGRQGREPWLEVIGYVIKLFSTTGDAAMKIIDRMNNLEHSNGMFMDRFPANVKSWYIKFLNAKYHSPTPAKLAQYISDSDLRELIVFFDTTEPKPKVEDQRDYREMEKEKEEDPNAINWLEKGYPYAPGKKQPKRTDMRVQENLETLREKGASMRIVEEVTNAIKDVEAAFRWKRGMESKTARTTRVSSR